MISFLYLTCAAFVLGLLITWILALLLRPFLSLLETDRWNFSSNFWFALAISPALIGLIAGFCTFLSGWVSWFGWITDHCLRHDGHPHLCLVHIGVNPPQGTIFWSTAICCLVIPAVALWRCFPRTRGLSGAFWQAAQKSGGFYIVPSSVPAAFTAGLLGPRPFLTDQAQRELDIQEKAVILAHEQEHVRRKDPLRLMILQWCSLWLPGSSTAKRKWREIVETECDQAAVRAGFAPDFVALTILKMLKAGSAHVSPSGSLCYAECETGNAIKRRIRALTSTPCQSWGAAPIFVPVLAILAVSLIFFPEVHHLLETILGWLR